MSFNCIECFDTNTIDRAGSEIACPYCPIEITIRGLGHGLGADGSLYSTATAHTASTITFRGTRGAILADVVAVRHAAELAARRAGRKGRNSITSGAIAIERHVRKALAS